MILRREDFREEMVIRWEDQGMEAVRSSPKKAQEIINSFVSCDKNNNINVELFIAFFQACFWGGGIFCFLEVIKSEFLLCWPKYQCNFGLVLRKVIRFSLGLNILGQLLQCPNRAAGWLDFWRAKRWSWGGKEGELRGAVVIAGPSFGKIRRVMRSAM